MLSLSLYQVWTILEKLRALCDFTLVSDNLTLGLLLNAFTLIDVIKELIQGSRGLSWIKRNYCREEIQF